MTLTTEYDAIVIGAGQAGEPLATTLARAGWKTALNAQRRRKYMHVVYYEQCIVYEA